MALDELQVKVLSIFWVGLLVIWVPMTLASGMAFDSGYTSAAYTDFVAFWSYPVTVGIALLSRRRAPALMLLPLFPLLLLLIT